jgi:hypothetical protein
MKKFFLALSVLAVLTFAAVPSQALVSMPDAVPGSDIMAPWFLAEISGGEDTLLTIQEVKGAATTLHIYLYDKSSIKRYDITTALTGYDVESWNVKSDFVLGMSSTNRTALEIDLDGDGTNDHYAGYVIFDNEVTLSPNNLVAFAYQVDLASGVASGAVIPAREREGNAIGEDYVDANGMEIWSAEALVSAKAQLAGLADQTATQFALYPRYFIYDSNAQNYFFFWKSDLDGTAFSPHVNFYDNAENAISSTFDCPYELNVLNLRTLLPDGLFSAYPYVGWIDFTLPDEDGNHFDAAEEYLGYMYQTVRSTGNYSWNALFTVHRDATTS